MEKMRVLGGKIKALLKDQNKNVEDLSNYLSCTKSDVEMALAGRSFFSFEQIDNVAEYLHVPIADLLKNHKADYLGDSIDCMKDFSKIENREAIIDLIYDYLDIVDSLSGVE